MGQKADDRYYYQVKYYVTSINCFQTILKKICTTFSEMWWLIDSGPDFRSPGFESASPTMIRMRNIVKLRLEKVTYTPEAKKDLKKEEIVAAFTDVAPIAVDTGRFMLLVLLLLVPLV